MIQEHFYELIMYDLIGYRLQKTLLGATVTLLNDLV